MKNIIVLLVIAVTFFLRTITTKAFIEKRQTEHPKIEAAIEKMQDAVDYMQNSPADFGGHKEVAIKDTKQAILSLRLALSYPSGPNAKN